MHISKGNLNSESDDAQRIFTEVILLSNDPGIKFETYCRWLKCYVKICKKNMQSYAKYIPEIADKATKALEIIPNAHIVHILWVCYYLYNF